MIFGGTVRGVENSTKVIITRRLCAQTARKKEIAMPEKKTLPQRVSRLERLAKSALVSDNIKAIIEDYLWTIEEVLCDAEELVKEESKLERLQ